MKFQLVPFGEEVIAPGGVDPRHDPIGDIDAFQGPVTEPWVAAMSTRVGAWVQIAIVQPLLDASADAAALAEAALRHTQARGDELTATLAAVSKALADAESIRIVALLLLPLCIAISLGAEYAWSLQTLPPLLDLDADTLLGEAVAALPVAALTSIELALLSLFYDHVRPLKKALRAGGLTNRRAGVAGIVASGLILLALNIELVLQLGTLRAILPVLGLPDVDTAAFAQARSVVDKGVQILGVVVAVDTAVLLLALQDELGVAVQVAGLMRARRRGERERRAWQKQLPCVTARHTIAVQQAASAADRAKARADEYVARAAEHLERKRAPKPGRTLTPEETADARLALPPGWDRVAPVSPGPLRLQ